MKLSEKLILILMTIALAFYVFGELGKAIKQVAGKTAEQIERAGR